MVNDMDDVFNVSKAESLFFSSLLLTCILQFVCALFLPPLLMRLWRSAT